EALGGGVRDQIRVYNTCVEARPVLAQGIRNERHEDLSEDWGIGGPPGGEHDDWTASIERPAELAADLLASGITAMKTYTFQRLVPETRGLFITSSQLEENLEPLREIRGTVGDGIDVAVDLASLWPFAPALQIARWLEDFNLLWLEDPVRISSIHEAARLARLIRTPIAGFDYRAGLATYAELINAGALSIVRIDLQWAGGISEALRIAGYADARGLGVVLHDCAGPVQWAAAIHCSLHLRNAMIQESARAYYSHVYPTMVKEVPPVLRGSVAAVNGNGHGAELLPSYLEGARRERSTVRNGSVVRVEIAP